MKNLVAFGCSMTYGHGLPDCFIPPDEQGPYPSKLAWPSKLAEIGNRNCINLSRSGSSNFEIALKIMSHKFEPDDVCFIMWSYLDRDLIIHDNNRLEQIGPWDDKTKLLKIWDTFNPIQTKLMKFWFIVASINTWLTSQQIQVYHLSLFFDYTPKNPPEWASNIQFLSTSLRQLRSVYPKALDGNHPGIECHEVVAEKIAQEIGWL
jgi:hypothetical protein